MKKDLSAGVIGVCGEAGSIIAEALLDKWVNSLFITDINEGQVQNKRHELEGIGPNVFDVKYGDPHDLEDMLNNTDIVFICSGVPAFDPGKPKGAFDDDIAMELYQRLLQEFPKIDNPACTEGRKASGTSGLFDWAGDYRTLQFLPRNSQLIHEMAGWFNQYKDKNGPYNGLVMMFTNPVDPLTTQFIHETELIDKTVGVNVLDQYRLQRMVLRQREGEVKSFCYGYTIGDHGGGVVPAYAFTELRGMLFDDYLEISRNRAFIRDKVIENFKKFLEEIGDPEKNEWLEPEQKIRFSQIREHILRSDMEDTENIKSVIRDCLAYYPQETRMRSGKRIGTNFLRDQVKWSMDSLFSNIEMEYLTSMSVFGTLEKFYSLVKNSKIYKDDVAPLVPTDTGVSIGYFAEIITPGFGHNAHVQPVAQEIGDFEQGAFLRSYQKQTAIFQIMKEVLPFLTGEVPDKKKQDATYRIRNFQSVEEDGRKSAGMPSYEGAGVECKTHVGTSAKPGKVEVPSDWEIRLYAPDTGAKGLTKRIAEFDFHGKEPVGYFTFETGKTSGYSHLFCDGANLYAIYHRTKRRVHTEEYGALIWNLNTRELMREIPLENLRPSSIFAHNGEVYIAFPDPKDGSIFRYSPDGNVKVSDGVRGVSSVIAVDLPDGLRIFGSAGSELYKWKAESIGKKHTSVSLDEDIYDLRHLRSGFSVLSARSNNKAVFIDIEGTHSPRSYQTYEGIYDVYVGKNSIALASADVDSGEVSVRLFDDLDMLMRGKGRTVINPENGPKLEPYPYLTKLQFVDNLLFMFDRLNSSIAIIDWQEPMRNPFVYTPIAANLFYTQMVVKNA